MTLRHNSWDNDGPPSYQGIVYSYLWAATMVIGFASPNCITKMTKETRGVVSLSTHQYKVDERFIFYIWINENRPIINC